MNEPAMVSELEQPKPLSRADRWRLTRALAGPSAFLGLILYSWLRGRMPLSVVLVGGILLFFLFAPGSFGWQCAWISPGFVSW